MLKREVDGSGRSCLARYSMSMIDSSKKVLPAGLQALCGCGKIHQDGKSVMRNILVQVHLDYL